jgi:hypothetical protein
MKTNAEFRRVVVGWVCSLVVAIGASVCPATAEEITPGSLPRPPAGIVPMIIVNNGHIYTNLGMPDALQCYIPPFIFQLPEEERIKIIQACATGQQISEYMSSLVEFCKKKNCVITFTGNGVYRLDILEPGSVSTPGSGGYAQGPALCDPETVEGRACEWRQTILRICRYKRDPLNGITLPGPLKQYIDTLEKLDPNFKANLAATCNNPNCAETLLDFNAWKNGGRCEPAPAIQIFPGGKPKPRPRCPNCQVIQTFVDNWSTYEGIIKNPPKPRPTGAGSSTGAIIGPRPLNPNWSAAIDAIGPMLIGAEQIYGAGSSMLLIGSGGATSSPGQMVGQTVVTGAQAVSGTYMVVGGAGMAISAIGYGGAGAAVTGIAAPAAVIGLAPIVGYGAGNVAGSMMTGGSMEDLLIGTQTIKVPPSQATCGERTKFLASSQGAFCNTEGRLNNWLSRGCSDCCQKAFQWQSGANADMKSCLAQGGGYRSQYLSDCNKMCNL